MPFESFLQPHQAQRGYHLIHRNRKKKNKKAN